MNPALLIYKTMKDMGVNPEIIDHEAILDTALHLETPVDVEGNQLIIPAVTLPSAFPVDDPEWPNVIGD